MSRTPTEPLVQALADLSLFQQHNPEAVLTYVLDPRLLPTKGGLYVVLVMGSSPNGRSIGEFRVLDIGIAKNLKERHVAHPRRGQWQRANSAGRPLAFGYYLVAQDHFRRELEGVWRRHYQPPCGDIPR